MRPMFFNRRFSMLVLALLLFALPTVAQDPRSSTAPGGASIHLDVVVTDKSGKAVSGLQLEDLTLLDNRAPQTITSFEAVDGRQARVEVVVVIDAVSVGARELAIEREEIKRFLKTDKGRLAYPTTFAVLTETGIQLDLGFSRDGNAISSALDHYRFHLRSKGRDADLGGPAPSFDSLFQLLAEEGERPGRKLIVWISPHWPMLWDAQGTADAKKGQQVLPNMVEISKQLREGHITLYMVDPSGTADLELGLQDIPVNHTRPADTATQSGGLALHPGNDMASAMLQCVADARTYYEISFNPTTADRPNEYHHLEIRVAKPGLTARTRQGYYSQPPRAENFTAASEQPGKAGGDNNTPGAAPADAGNAVYAIAHPYLDWPMAQLTEHIPELQAIQPAADQQQLPVILENMGRTVDDFVRNIGDLIADEDVTQEKLNAKGKVEAKERVRDNYLILHHGYEWGAGAEYRMDDKGNRLGPIGLEKGYLVTSGSALSCISFSSVVQPQSRFRYLGEEKLGSRETYVLAFAQKPGEATFTNAMRGTGGHEVDMLTQGVLWVDKNSFQILRMRSDLLVPNAEIGLDQLTTEVTFGEVRIQDVQNPLWLPSEVNVYMQINKQKYRNVHHYTNYRRYRVSVEIGASQ
jgi:VWFA-related protein